MYIVNTQHAFNNLPLYWSSERQQKKVKEVESQNLNKLYHTCRLVSFISVFSIFKSQSLAPWAPTASKMHNTSIERMSISSKKSHPPSRTLMFLFLSHRATFVFVFVFYLKDTHFSIYPVHFSFDSNWIFFCSMDDRNDRKGIRNVLHAVELIQPLCQSATTWSW